MQSTSVVVLKCANVIDGKGKYLPGTDITIKNGKIFKVNPTTTSDSSVDSKTFVYDATNMSVLPGFIDSHVHLLMNGASDIGDSLLGKTDILLAMRALSNAKAALTAGFTTIQDLGCKNGISLALRDAIASGMQQEPRIFACGSIICITGGHGSTWGGREADGVSECRKAVREQVKQGADIIKVAASGGVVTRGSNPNACEFSEDELQAIVDEAHNRGRKVAAHAHSDVSISTATRAGVDFIQHGSFATTKTLELMAANNTMLVPCIYSAVVQAESEALARYLREGCKPIVESHKSVVKEAKELGIKIALGSDAGTPLNYFGHAAKEFEFLTMRGLSNMEAIVAGTYNAARVVGVEDTLGSVEQGKIADLIVMDGNPLDNINVLQDSTRIMLIIKEGRVVYVAGTDSPPPRREFPRP